MSHVAFLDELSGVHPDQVALSKALGLTCFDRGVGLYLSEDLRELAWLLGLRLACRLVTM